MPSPSITLPFSEYLLNSVCILDPPGFYTFKALDGSLDDATVGLSEIPLSSPGNGLLRSVVSSEALISF